MTGRKQMVLGVAILTILTFTGLAVAQPQAKSPAVKQERVKATHVVPPQNAIHNKPDLTTVKPELTLPIRSCPANALRADVVAIDHPIVFNRLGAQNVNWMMYALRHDVIDLKTNKSLDYSTKGKELFGEVVKRTTSRDIALRPDLRPRPLVLRVAEGGYLKVVFTNLLEVRPVVKPEDTPGNPFNSFPDPLPNIDHPMEHAAKDDPLVPDRKLNHIDDQVASRVVGFHPQGLELVPIDGLSGIHSDSSNVGKNPDSALNSPNAKAGSMVEPGRSTEYCFFAPKEGAYLVSNDGAVFGGEGTAGNSGVGLFGVVAVQPKGAQFYRAQVTEEELRLATRKKPDGTPIIAPSGQPVIVYDAIYENKLPWSDEGKSGFPILNMVQNDRIIHGDINAIIVGPNPDGSFPRETYPIEKDVIPNLRVARNPTLPNRLEPFREFVSVFHDENAATQSYPYFFDHPELGHTLHGVRDAFMINYGSGGIGAEIIANRLHSGPMHDCLDCAYEEFFLSSFAVGDAAMIVDYPANMVTHQCQPEFLPNQDGKWTSSDMENNFKAKCVQEKWATEAYYPHDPANLHHSYIGDFVKFRNVHSGKEQHIFHLHNHQWLFNPNDDNSNYIDAQGLGPGSGYTYEIAFGGSGNRNKTVGDAIFHCHFYPHFAQGMWYMWRNHDVFEAGTHLAVSDTRTGYHTEQFGLMHGKPSEKARALPDGEIVAGTPIPAIVPLPGKGMAPMPLPVTVEPRKGDDGGVHGSFAKVCLGSIDSATGKCQEEKKLSSHDNPGFPFWVAGVSQRDGHAAEDLISMGSRPTTPPLDMDSLAGGHDGGLPRHALAGYSAGGHDHSEITRLSAAKHVTSAKPVYYDEGGTPLELVAMKFHAEREHPTSKVDMNQVASSAKFITNGAPAIAGAPFNDPCIDDSGHRLTTGGQGDFFAGHYDEFFSSTGLEFGGDIPRVYKGANLQLDVVFNKVGYHYPQQRILTLWEDVPALLRYQRPPEPLVLRMNTYDCAKYEHTNLVPKEFYLDDYQITTPTDVIGQHIHLPKWDLTSADGGANGFNYEDGTFAPGAVRERIHAINEWNRHSTTRVSPTAGYQNIVVRTAHPYFGKDPIFQSGSMLQLTENACLSAWGQKDWESVTPENFKEFEQNSGVAGKCDWLGARTTIQRWFSDPIVNRFLVHRGLGITFTHDHLGPSTHQQLGLYATMLTEPPNSKWVHNETGVPLYTRADGGPTTWQAVIAGERDKEGKPSRIDVDKDGGDDSHREFFLQFGDFQHASQKGVYVGVNKDRVPQNAEPTRESFRQAINPSLRKPLSPVFPDILAFERTCPGGRHVHLNDLLPGSVYLTATDFSNPALYDPISGQPWRPCPEAISADDVGMMVVNYRNEPIGARVYDPNKDAPHTKDGKKGDQAAGFSGDLTFALQTRTDRKIPELNTELGATPYPALTFSVFQGDPFTPIMRAYAGDLVRVKIQAGSHEHEHNGAINGLAWMQGGAGFGQAPYSGWRNGQNIGLSEQFTLSASLIDYESPTHLNDRLYTVDSSQDGMWNGVWGLLRSMNRRDPDPKVDRLVPLPSNPKPTLLAPNEGQHFDNACPKDVRVRHYHVAAVLANRALEAPDNSLGIKIPHAAPQATLISNGGTLIYNPRLAEIEIQLVQPSGEVTKTKYNAGPLHDPTAILFVRFRDLDKRGKIRAESPVEPIVLRAAAGECIEVVLHNLLPRDRQMMPDLDGYTTVSGVIRRDAGSPSSKMTSFNNNLVRPSNRIGLHPQMVQYDVQGFDGNNVGVNKIGTVRPGKSKAYQWYAGVIEAPLDNKFCPDEVRGATFDELNKFAQLPGFQPLSEFVSLPVVKLLVADILKESIFEQRIKQLLGDKPQTEILVPDPKPFAVISKMKAPRQRATVQISAGVRDLDTQIREFRKREGAAAQIKADDIQLSPKIGAKLAEEMSALTEILVSGLGKNETWSKCLMGYGALGGIFPTGAGNDEPDTTPDARPTQKQSFDRSSVVSLLDPAHKLNILKQRVDCRSQQGELPGIFLIQLEKARAKTGLSLNEWVSLVTPDVAKMVTEKFVSGILSELLSMDVEGIDPGKTEKDTYAWRQTQYPTLGPDTTRLIKLDRKFCRYEGVEFGGSNLTPPDRIKQGQKGAVGALVIEPERSRWSYEWTDKPVDDLTTDRQKPGQTRKSRATATVKYPVTIQGEGKSRPKCNDPELKPEQRCAEFRESVLVHQKGLNLRYKDGSAVANLAAEKEKAIETNTAPEDAHDSGHMAINYGTEPMWFRFGLSPDSVFGKGGFGGVIHAYQAFSNGCCAPDMVVAPYAKPNVGEPYTPIATAYAGSELRIRALLPTGVGRATTFSLHGHNWPRDPYLAEHTWSVAPDHGEHSVGGRPAEWGVPAKCIGYSATQMGMGGQESLTPMAHFDLILKSAGGKHAVAGDYLWQDHGGFGITSGLWSLVRVVAPETSIQKHELRTPCKYVP